jgi:hypothetical protein
MSHLYEMILDVGPRTTGFGRRENDEDPGLNGPFSAEVPPFDRGTNAAARRSANLREGKLFR